MKKMLDMMHESGSGMPVPINVNVRYDATLAKITGCREEPIMMSEGSTFLYLLQNVFISHPDIEKHYPPGALEFDINGIPPKTYTPLFDGNIVNFSIPAPFK